MVSDEIKSDFKAFMIVRILNCFEVITLNLIVAAEISPIFTLQSAGIDATILSGLYNQPALEIDIRGSPEVYIPLSSPAWRL